MNRPPDYTDICIAIAILSILSAFILGIIILAIRNAQP